MIHFEELELGAARTAGDYVVEEQEMIDFARKWDPQPFHIDATAADASQFGRITASSAMVFCIISVLFNRLEPIALICGLKNEFTMKLPVYAGDRLALSIACTEKRPSATKPDRGIARFEYQVTNQDGGVVADGAVSFMISRSANAG
jgi:acyl dehydratase